MDTPSVAERIVRAIATVEEMLRARGEMSLGVSRLSDDDVRSAVLAQPGNAFVRFDTGSRDIVFFTKKLKTADIAKAAAAVPEDRRGDAMLVTLDSLMTVHARSVASHFGPVCEMFTLPALGFNIARSTIVPKHELVPRDAHAGIKEKLGVATLSQLPLIESGDPMAKYARVRPGDVVKITRLHPSAGHQIAYRYCRK